MVSCSPRFSTSSVASTATLASEYAEDEKHVQELSFDDIDLETGASKKVVDETAAVWKVCNHHQFFAAHAEYSADQPQPLLVCQPLMDDQPHAFGKQAAFEANRKFWHYVISIVLIVS